MVRVRRTDKDGPILVELIVMHADRLRSLESEEAMRNAVTRRATLASDEHRKVISATTPLQTVVGAIKNRFGADAFVFLPQTPDGMDWSKPIGHTPSLFVGNGNRPVFVFAVDTLPPTQAPVSTMQGDGKGAGEGVASINDESRVACDDAGGNVCGGAGSDVCGGHDSLCSGGGSVASVVVTTFAEQEPNAVVAASLVPDIVHVQEPVPIPMVLHVADGEIAAIIRQMEVAKVQKKPEVAEVAEVAKEEPVHEKTTQGERTQGSLFGPTWRKPWWQPQ